MRIDMGGGEGWKLLDIKDISEVKSTGFGDWFWGSGGNRWGQDILEEGSWLMKIEISTVEEFEVRTKMGWWG